MQQKTKQLPKGSAPVFEVTDATALAALPNPNSGDIFFDFEGDPLYQEGEKWNLDYLFGYVDEKSARSCLSLSTELVCWREKP